jgi:hypothetical protein
MKYAISSAALVAGAVSQATFEPADFNITEALLDNGVNVSAIPELAPLVERSLLSGCSIAVSTNSRQCQSHFSTDDSPV